MEESLEQFQKKKKKTMTGMHSKGIPGGIFGKHLAEICLENPARIFFL